MPLTTVGTGAGDSAAWDAAHKRLAEQDMKRSAELDRLLTRERDDERPAPAQVEEARPARKKPARVKAPPMSMYDAPDWLRGLTEMQLRRLMNLASAEARRRVHK